MEERPKTHTAKCVCQTQCGIKSFNCFYKEMTLAVSPIMPSLFSTESLEPGHYESLQHLRVA